MPHDQTTQPAIYCRQCGYDLRNLAEDRCPECGRAFDPADSRTFSLHPRNWYTRRWIYRITLAMAALVLLAGTGLAVLYVQWRSVQADILAIQQAGGRVETSPVGPPFLQHLLGAEFVLPRSNLPECLHGLFGTRFAYLLERPTEIIWDGPACTDANLVHLSSLTNIRSLRLSGSHITDAGLAHLARLSNVQYLDLAGTAVTGSGLRHLKGMKHLCDLFLSRTNVNDDALTNIADLASLEGLVLERTRITGSGFACLQGLPILHRLGLADTLVTNGSLADLQHLKCLQRLTLSRTAITDAGLANLHAATNLRELTLENTRISDAGLAQLKDLPSLHMIMLANTGVTDAGLEYLKTMPALHKDSLPDPPELDRAVTHVEFIKVISLTGTSVTSEGVSRFKAAIPDVQVSGP